MMGSRATIALLVTLCCLPLVSGLNYTKPIGVSTGADFVFKIMADGRERQYTLHVPPGYVEGTPIPLVVDMHGFTSTADRQMSISGFYAVSDEETFAVAYPTGGGWPGFLGFNGSPSSTRPGCCGTPASSNWDDIAFIRAIVHDASQRITINTKKVYSTGLSNGSYMTHRVGCFASDTFAALGSTAAALSLGWSQCVPSHPRPMFYMHGTRDTTQPIGGSPNIAGERILSMDDSMDVYAQRNGCSDQQETTGQWGHTVCYRRLGCTPGLELEYCKVDAPHVTYDNSDIHMARMWWNFFKKYSL